MEKLGKFLRILDRVPPTDLRCTSNTYMLLRAPRMAKAARNIATTGSDEICCGGNGAPSGVVTAVDLPRIERAVREILAAVGEDPDREGLVETPARVARMYAEMFSGLRQDPRIHTQKFFSE